MSSTGAGPGARSAIRQTVWITLLALAAYIVIRNLPTDGGALHYTDFGAGQGGPLEFCEPGGPQFVPVDRVRSPVALAVRTENDGPLRAGEPARLLVALTSSTGKPVGPDDLLVAHTKKLHLLVVDATLEDYQHLHPDPAALSGVYAVDFTPRRAGEYRVFADFVPRATGRALYAGARLAVEDGRARPQAEPNSPTATTIARPEASPYLRQQDAVLSVGSEEDSLSTAETARDNRRDDLRATLSRGQATAIDGSRRSVVDDYEFELSLDREPLRINETAELRLTVRAPDGSAAILDEIMGARAHVVAFDQAISGFAHLHPLEAPAETCTDGEPLRFELSLSDPGTYRLWAQVKIAGEERFAPFELTLRP